MKLKFLGVYLFILFYFIPFNKAKAQCFIDTLNVIINACNPADNSYSADVYVSWTSAPSTGMLIILDSLSGVADTIYPPFTSDQTYILSGMNSSGGNSAIIAYFTANTSCNLFINYVAQPPCGCNANAGTSTVGILGSGLNNYILCEGDSIVVFTNGDTTLPAGADPGITYAIYNCPPTSGNIDPATDPCFTGYTTGTVMIFLILIILEQVSMVPSLKVVLPLLIILFIMLQLL